MNASEHHHRIDYVEFAVRDLGVAKSFYGRAFGWTFTDYGPTYCEFRDGRLTGGFTTEGTIQPGGPLVILYSRDLVETRRAVEKVGGKITRPPFEFPGGRRFHFEDRDGYELAVWSDR